MISHWNIGPVDFDVAFDFLPLNLSGNADNTNATGFLPLNLAFDVAFDFWHY